MSDDATSPTPPPKQPSEQAPGADSESASAPEPRRDPRSSNFILRKGRSPHDIQTKDQ